MKTVGLILAASLLVLAPSTGWSEEIYIDLDHQSTDPGGNWNTPPAPWTATDLIDFKTGLPTTVDLDASWWGHNTNGWIAGDVGWVDADAAYDHISFLGVGTTDSVVISQLAGSAYRVEVVAASLISSVADYSIGGVFATNTHNGPGTSDDWDLSAARASGNWMIWYDVTPVGGTITIDVTVVSGTEAVMNAIKITDDPVPVELSSFHID